MSPVDGELPASDLEELLEQAPVFFAVVRGPDYVFERANDAYQQLIGHREIVGKPLLEALPEIEGQGFVELLDRVVRTGKAIVMRAVPIALTRVRGAPSEEVYVDFIYHPLRDAGGRNVGVIAVGSDVSDQVVARKQAEEARGRVVEILSALSDAVNVFDRNGQLTFMNEAAADLFRSVGKDPATLLGKRVWDELSLILGTRFEAEIRLALEQNRTTELEEHIPGIDRCFETRFVPSANSVTSFTRDVTQRRKTEGDLRASEEQFRTAVNSIPALAWMANADGWIFWYNARWYEYTGTTPSEMEGWGWQSVHDPEILPAVMERWTVSIATGRPFEMEFPLRGSTGEFRWFLTRVAPLFDAEGKLARWFGTNTDVHSQREAAEAALAANQAKSDFLAAMSHETRQPINATLGFIDVLELGMYGVLTDEQKQALTRIRVNQEQLRSVVDDILTFARLEAGRVELDLDAVACCDVLEAVPSLVEPQVAARGLTLSVEPCDPSLAVRGDRSRILQICTNLLTNSTRATEKGGVLRVRCVAAQGSVDIEIEDTGSGIPREKMDVIFNPFVQLERGLSRPREGVGLGLAISRDLARAMGGDISARSEVGKGSTFVLTLPRAQLGPRQ